MPRLIREHPQRRYLVGHRLQYRLIVIAAEAHQEQQASADLADYLVFHGNRCRSDPLQ